MLKTRNTALKPSTYNLQPSRFVLWIKKKNFLSKHGKGKKKYNSKPALDLIKKYEISEAEGKGDDSVLFLAKKHNAVVVTNDKYLRKRAKDIHLQTIYLREKSKLVLD